MARQPKPTQSEIDGVQYRRAKTWQIILQACNALVGMSVYTLIGMASYSASIGYGISTAIVGVILAGTRILDGVDLFILEEDYVFDGLGENYFAPIPEDVADQYFPDAALYSETGQIYAIRLDKDGGSRFSEFYGGNETCLIFINAASVNTGAMNGRGDPEDTAALEMASYLWREGK